MASRLIVPFDYNPPISTSVKTTSFTIPANQYARCLVECDSGGIVTIDGVNAVTTAAFQNIAVNSSSGAYTTPANYIAHIASVGSAGNVAVRFNGATNAATSIQGGTAIFPSATIGPGGTVTYTLSQNNATTGAAIPSNATHRQAEFWLRAGQTLSGTGNWRAIVTQYNVVS